MLHTTLARPPSPFPTHLPCLAFAASLLTSLTLGCGYLHSKASSPPSSDADEPSPTPSPTFTLPAPIETLKHALGVLLYQPSSSPPPHPQPATPPPAPFPLSSIRWCWCTASWATLRC